MALAAHPDPLPVVDTRRYRDLEVALQLVDVAAEAHNAKLLRYFTPEQNGLEQSWSGERVWCNPPYSDIRPWVEKARQESTRAQLIVMLLPANRTEQAWWQELVEPYRDRRAWWRLSLKVEFLPGRIRFIRSGSIEVGPNERPPFGSCLLIWSNEPLREAIP